MKSNPVKAFENGIEWLIFNSRWLQLPLYLGLIAACGIYSYRFAIDVIHLWAESGSITEEQLLLSVLSLVDITMIVNLIIIVIIGGYATFVSRLDLENEEDRPEWLNHVSAGSLKVKLATSLISVSAIHLLRSFVDVHNMVRVSADVVQQPIFWQVVIHVVFLCSALILAYTEKVMLSTSSSKHTE